MNAERSFIDTFFGTVFVAVLSMSFGAIVGAEWEQRRVHRIVHSHVVVDGMTDGLSECSLGCKTENDVTCEKFLEMMMSHGRL